MGFKRPGVSEASNHTSVLLVTPKGSLGLWLYEKCLQYLSFFSFHLTVNFKEWLTPCIEKWKKKNTAEEKYLLGIYLK